MKSYLYFVKRHVGDSETQGKRFSVLTRIKFTFSALAQSINFVQYNTTHHPDNTLKHGDGSIMCALHQQELGKWSGLRARWMKSNKGQYSGGGQKTKTHPVPDCKRLGTGAEMHTAKVTIERFKTKRLNVEEWQRQSKPRPQLY